MLPDPAGEHAEGDVPPLRVLYVDDNRDVADSAVILLQVVGFEAVACYDGLTALQQAQAFNPGLCMIDLNMPGMDGDELATHLRENLHPPPLMVAVSAMGDEDSRSRTAAAGFDLHLVKPVDPKKMIAVVDTLYKTWSVRSATWREGSAAKSN